MRDAPDGPTATPIERGAGDRLQASLPALAAAHGLRLTAKRRRVAEIVDAFAEPLEFGAVWRQVCIVWPRCDRSLVYRALKQLLEAGVLVPAGVEDGRRVFVRTRKEPRFQIFGAPEDLLAEGGGLDEG